MPISRVEDGWKNRGRARRRGLSRADTPSDILAPSHQRRITVVESKQNPPTRGQHIMRQAWRGLAGLLAVGVVAAGGSVALAADGGGHGGRDNNGNRGNKALATTIFTMPAAPHANPEGVAVDKRWGRFFVSRTGTGAIFAGTLGSPTLSPFIAGVRPNPAPTDPPVATGLKVRKGLLYVAGASTG